MNPLMRMDAARACLMYGNVFINDRHPQYDVIVEYLADIKNGDNATWRYFDFTGKNVSRFTCKTFGGNLDGTIEIHIDSASGELIGTCEMKELKENLAYSIYLTKIKPVIGKHAVVLVFKAKNSTNKVLCNLDWFVFESENKS